MSQRLRLAESGTYFEALSVYGRRVADGIGLRDYEVEVEHRPASEGSIAECDVSPMRRAIRLRVCQGFSELPPEHQRHAVVHEFVHAFFVGVSTQVEENVTGWMPTRTYEMFQQGFERELERGVDALSVVISEHVPLPIWH